MIENITFTPVQMLGYLSCTVPFTVTASLDKEIQEMLDSNFENATSYKSKLAGASENEYLIEKSASVIEEFIDEVVPNYWKAHKNYEQASKRHRIRFTDNKTRDVWVNFAKKGDYNPLHTHGGLLRFVLWHKIPYQIQNEKNQPNVRDGSVNPAAAFIFNYPDFFAKGGVNQWTINADQTWENTMIIFPSVLQHSVYPFQTSDDYRISISGNIDVENTDRFIQEIGKELDNIT